MSFVAPPSPSLQGGSAEISLEAGKVFKLSIDEQYKESGTDQCIYVDYKNIVKIMNPGDIVYIDDGLISLKVREKNGTTLITGEAFLGESA